MSEPSRAGRLVSLDVFRGLTVAGMILVNNPGSWAHIYAPLRHAEWHGWTPTDLIFPYFLFILGVAIPFAFARRLREGQERPALIGHVLRRGVVLVALGLAMRAVPDFDFASMRWPGVLQRIGLVYVAAAGLYLTAGSRARMVWTAVLLLGYWAVMVLVPVPGYGAGALSPEGNPAAWLDRALMEGHLWQAGWDPEGLLSTLPAVATALLGVATGERLRAGERAGGHAAGLASTTRDLVVHGAVLVAAGSSWGALFPINKNLWTSSYVLFTAGTALLVLGALHEAVDVRRSRGPWIRPWVVFGRNAIAAFVLSGMLAKSLARIRIGGADGASLHGWIHREMFASWAGALNGSLLFAVTYVALWLAVMTVLDRWGIHLRI